MSKKKENIVLQKQKNSMFLNKKYMSKKVLYHCLFKGKKFKFV